MSTKDSLRSWLAGIAWFVGLVTYFFVVCVANKGDSSFALKTIFALSLISGIPQGIGFALTIGRGAAGGGITASIWAGGITSSAFLALYFGIYAGIIDLIAWSVLMILAQFLANKKNA